MDIFEPNELVTLDVENLRLHSAKTLETWGQRFELSKEEITAIMDEEFVRAWSLYLYGSLAAFNVGELQLFQVMFGHVENNDIPWSRQHVYELERNKTAIKTKLTIVTSETE